VSGWDRILYVVGARPNFVKMAPVIAELRRRLPGSRHVLVHTGQHYDEAMSAIFLDELGVPAPDHMLEVGSGSHAVQTARVLERIEPVLEQERPQLVIVPGDVNSTLAAALAAAKLEIPVAHIESGLRSFDRSMPEEINRALTDNLASYLFIHSEEAATNLVREGIPEGRIHFAGNTMIDTLVAFEPRFRAAQSAARQGLRPDDYLLVTLHRPSLVDGPLLFEVLHELGRVSRHLPVVFPVHPRTRKRLGSFMPSPGLHLLDPVGYIDFLSLEADAAAVLTDSGGVQEETAYMGVPCFTLRANTERPVTVRLGTNTILGLDPARIGEIPRQMVHRRRPHRLLPGWDGFASQRVADALGAPRAPVAHPESLVSPRPLGV
jgi:UDP-N-acetylglucosamine 2-epimerase (non-hydrolysing)